MKKLKLGNWDDQAFPDKYFDKLKKHGNKQRVKPRRRESKRSRSGGEGDDT